MVKSKLTLFTKETIRKAKFARAVGLVPATIRRKELISAGGLRHLGAVVSERTSWPPRTPWTSEERERGEPGSRARRSIENVCDGGQKVTQGCQELTLG